MTIKISEKLFKGIYKWLFVIMIAFLPQFAFLGSYINNDSLALFSISMIIYSWIFAYENKWNVKSCILLGTGIGICALSYYNAYGYILFSIIFFIASNIFLNNKFDFKDILKKGVIIAGIAFLIAGWWFIRNAIIYNGDFLGLSTETEYSEMYAKPEFKPSARKTPKREGKSLWQMISSMHWARMTYRSFIGLFGYMSILIPLFIYRDYFILFVIGFIGFLFGFKELFIYNKEKNNDKNKILMNFSFVGTIIIPIILSLYYSYTSDFQPQGRYIMPMLIPFMYFIVFGISKLLDKIVKNKIIKNILITILIGIIIYICLFCLIKVIIPFYNIL